MKTDRQLQKADENIKTIAWFVTSHMKGEIHELKVSDDEGGLYITDTNGQMYYVLVQEAEEEDGEVI